MSTDFPPPPRGPTDVWGATEQQSSQGMHSTACQKIKEKSPHLSTSLTPAFPATRSHFGYNREFWRHLWFFLTLYLWDYESIGARGERRGMRFGFFSVRFWRVLVIIGLNFLSAQLLVNFFSPLLGPFIEAIVDLDEDRFFRLSGEALGIVMAMAAIIGLCAFLGEQTALEWRARIVRYSSDLYFSGEGAHIISRVSSRSVPATETAAPPDPEIAQLESRHDWSRDIDNVDQRIATCSREFTQLGVGVIFGSFVFTSPVVSQIFTMFIALASVFESSGWIPAAVLLVFILAACLAVPPLMQRVAVLTFRQDHAEGDLRYKHTLVRTFAETIGFMSPVHTDDPDALQPKQTGSEESEHDSANRLFYGVRDNYSSLIAARCYLQFSTQAFGALSSPLAMWVMWMVMMWDDHEFDGVGDALTLWSQFGRGSGAIMGVLMTLALIAPVAGSCHRIGELNQRMLLLLHRITALKEAKIPDPTSADVEDGGDTGETIDFAGSGRTEGKAEAEAKEKAGLSRERISVRNLWLRLPAREASQSETPVGSGRVLVRDLSFVIDHDPSSFRRPGADPAFSEHSLDDLCQPEPRFSDKEFTAGGVYVVRGTGLAIQGPSGCGKSSLLRVLSGIWDPFSGAVDLPPAARGDPRSRPPVCFVPQRPYLCDGTLREILCYPHDPDALLPELPDKLETARQSLHREVQRDAQTQVLETCLRRVALDSLLEAGGLDKSRMRWSDVLSTGEQQRLSIARILFLRPTFAIMDEATSALDVKLQHRCLQACLEERITLVSVAHRPTVLPYHSHVLTLDMSGDWTLEPVNQGHIQEARRLARLAVVLAGRENIGTIAAVDGTALDFRSTRVPTTETRSPSIGGAQGDSDGGNFDGGANAQDGPSSGDSSSAAWADVPRGPHPEPRMDKRESSYGWKSWVRLWRLMKLGWDGRFTEFQRLQDKRQKGNITVSSPSCSGSPEERLETQQHSHVEEEEDKRRPNLGEDYRDWWESPRGTRALCLFILLASSVSVLSQYWATFVSGTVATVLIEEGTSAAVRPLVSVTLLYLISAIASVASQYLGASIGLRWRTEMILWLHWLYFQPKSAYLVNSHILSHTGGEVRRTVADDTGKRSSSSSSREPQTEEKEEYADSWPRNRQQFADPPKNTHSTRSADYIAGGTPFQSSDPATVALLRNDFMDSSAADASDSSLQQGAEMEPITERPQEVRRHEVDNVDQRLTRDLLHLSELGVTVFFGDGNWAGLMNILTQVLLYAATTVSVGGWFTLASTIGNCVFGVLVAQTMLPGIVRSTYVVQLKEGLFRFFHSQVRIFNESIAFCDGEARESRVAAALFADLYRYVRKRWMPRQARLVAFMSFFMYWTGIVAYVSVGIGVMYFSIDLDRYSGNRTSAVQTVVQQISLLGIILNLIPTSFNSLSVMFGLVNRVAVLDEHLRQVRDAELFAYAKENTHILPDPATTSSPGVLQILSGLEPRLVGWSADRSPGQEQEEEEEKSSPSRSHGPISQLPELLTLRDLTVFFPGQAIHHYRAQSYRAITEENVLTTPDPLRLSQASDHHLQQVSAETPLLEDGFNWDSSRALPSQPLFTDLSFSLPYVTARPEDATAELSNLLIVGRSGIGKTSLLRVIAGLWPFQKGTLERPSRLWFLSQRPYLSRGTLREALLGRRRRSRSTSIRRANLHPPPGYLPGLRDRTLAELLFCIRRLQDWAVSSTAAGLQTREEEEQQPLQLPRELEDQLLQAVLKQCRLSYLLEEWNGLDRVSADWREVLSGGEQQRLAFARLFAARIHASLSQCQRFPMPHSSWTDPDLLPEIVPSPIVAIMDEATNALDDSTERCCMEACRVLKIPMISVSHRPQMLEHHQWLLQLEDSSPSPAAAILNTTVPLSRARLFPNPHFRVFT